MRRLAAATVALAGGGSEGVVLRRAGRTVLDGVDESDRQDLADGCDDARGLASTTVRTRLLLLLPVGLVRLQLSLLWLLLFVRSVSVTANPKGGKSVTAPRMLDRGSINWTLNGDSDGFIASDETEANEMTRAAETAMMEM